jgi:3-deoxy-D-manno-octulosonate 8-phosphate phosphatase (KDO 8-P phosphatase)
MNNSLFERITTFIFDVDGVLTDSTILLFENGLQARRMNIKDGYALQLAIKKGYRVLIVSGGESAPVVDRLNKLGITEIRMGVNDKKSLVADYIEQNGLKKDEVLFMGDDMPDLSVMMAVGLATCPADAVPEIKGVSRYISPANGGHGCVRDVIEKVLKLNEHWHHEQDIASR